MLKFHSSMFFGESIKREHRRLLRRMAHGKRVKKDLILLTLAVNRTDLMDLIPASELRLSVRKEQTLYVLGLAGSREEALELLQVIIWEVYNQTGDVDVRSYFASGFED